MQALFFLIMILPQLSLSRSNSIGPVNNILVSPSTIAFSITEKDAHIESITFDSKRKTFYLGAIHKRKILQTDPTGKSSNFTTDNQDGLYSVLGLKADSKRRFLWACTTALPQMNGFTKADDGKVSILRFNLDNKKLEQQYTLPDHKYKHILGEPLIASNGDVYISDSGYPAIYRIRVGSDSLELFLLTKLRSLQGIAFSSDETVLFIADYSSGIHRYDMKSGQFTKLIANEATNVRGIDGLYFYKNQLIAIQNGISPNRILQLKLDKTLRQIIGETILEAGNPLFNEPTSGVIVGKKFYFIANSQWSHYNKDNTIFPLEKLDNTVILKLSLN